MAYTFDRLIANEQVAIADAQEMADRHGAPCRVWHRDGWFVVCETSDDDFETDPTERGWQDWAIVDPTEATR